METQTSVKEICPSTTQTWVKKGALLVDIREGDEVARLAFDVPNILNIPLSEFDKRYREIAKDSATVIVSSNPLKSLRAAGFLVNHGYNKVVNMKYGLERWVQKGFSTKGDIAALFDENSCCSSTSCC